MVSLEKSEKFQKEFQQYLKSIDEIVDLKTKAKLQQLSQDLLSEVRSLDREHSKLLVKGTLTEYVDHSRTKIINIRKQLDKIIKDYNKISK